MKIKAEIKIITHVRPYISESGARKRGLELEWINIK